MSFWKQAVISLILLLVLSVGFLAVSYGPGVLQNLNSASASAGTPPAAPTRPAPLVVLSPVLNEAADTSVKSIGTARAEQHATLYPEVAGRVADIGVIAGQRVEAGQMIVRLEDQAERLAVDRARLAVEDAQAQLERYEALSQRDAVSDVQLSDARLSLANAHLDLREAQDALDRRLIAAPFDGEIGLIDVGPGDYVTVATPVANLDQRQTLIVEFRVPERFAGRVRTGQAMTLSAPALPGEQLIGRIAGMDSRLDPVSRTLMIQGSIANDDDIIRPGMSFEVELSFAGELYASVPSPAVQWDRDGSYVFKANGDTALRTPIEIVSRQDGRVLVNGDLESGDKVVSEGTNAVRAGQTFRTLQTSGEAATGA